MCGRYVQTKNIDKYARRFANQIHRAQVEAIAATWNLAPTRLSWTIRAHENELEAVPLRWGFGNGVPSPINARVETAASKFTFRESWQHRRCLVPADGWYEWKFEDGRKQPYYFTRRDDEPIYFAGLWTGETFCLFTTAADGELTAVHHRKPLAVTVEDGREWLRLPMETDVLIHQAVRADAFRFFPVGKAVSNWRNDGPSLIEPVSQSLPREEGLLF